jgi:hypothetical protein
VTVYTAVKAVQDIVTPIVDASRDHIGTHSATCYRYHVACLAVLISDSIREELKS